MSYMLSEIVLPVRLTGTVDETARWIEDKQLLNRELWRKFVQEFRIKEDSADGAWRGEYWGKMMRGAVLIYKYTNNPLLYEILTETVQDMMSAAEEDGRISSYKRDREFFSWDIWCRKYVILGMEFYLEICKNDELKQKIIENISKQCDYLTERIGDGPSKVAITDTSVVWGGMNSSSLLEPVVKLYGLTKEERYLDFARHIISKGGSKIANVFEEAYKDQLAPYQYGISKAYEMMSCFEGLLEYYNVTGDEKAKETVIKFSRKVLETDITVIGSAGCTHELFDNSRNRQTIITEGFPEDRKIMQETCVTVTWMKLCSKMFRLTGDAIYGDALERSFYNAYLGSLNKNGYADARAREDIASGRAIYTFLPFDSYAPLTKGVRGIRAGGYQILADKTYYGCCACIASAGAGIFAKSQVFKSEKGYVINGFEDGTVYFTETDSFSFAGGYPYGDGTVRITVNTGKPFSCRISFRGASSASFGGKIYRPYNGFVNIFGTCKDGDVISLTFDTSLKVTYAPLYDPETVYLGWSEKEPSEVSQNPEERKMISLSRGPVVLAMDRSITGDIDSPASPIQCNDVKGITRSGCRFAAEIETSNRGRIILCDYASAGQSWNKDTEMCAWFKGE